MTTGYHFSFAILATAKSIKVLADEGLWKWRMSCIANGFKSFTEFWERNLAQFIKMKLYIFLT